MSTASGEPSKKLTWLKKMSARIKPISSGHEQESDSNRNKKNSSSETK